MTIPKIDECDCDDFKSYCEYSECSSCATPNGYWSCEGRGCPEAYDKWIEEKGETCEDDFINDYGYMIEDINGKEHFVCEACHYDSNNEIKIINIKIMGSTI